jgi:alkyl sulfatase BDS1-like metallo-beta-lactamase superfamily hydrolase
MGWYDGNPANLDGHPPVEAARRYVRYMGGGEAILANARADFEAGDYRWTAEVLSRLVFAEPGNREAALLLADSFEQLGYQAESGPWRSIYLSGAKELREGIPAELAAARTSPDVLAALPPAELFRLLAVRIDGTAHAATDASLNLVFPDLGERWSLTLRRGVLIARPKLLEGADATLTIPRTALTAVLGGARPLAAAVADGTARIAGDPAAIAAILGAAKAPPPRFPLVTRPALEAGAAPR